MDRSAQQNVQLIVLRPYQYHTADCVWPQTLGRFDLSFSRKSELSNSVVKILDGKLWQTQITVHTT